ncbi:hypothetical protein RU98_GL002398 [Enterococcus caccae]|nr:hypothetical protein RU98_GL002398 [Enterococcus caccae]
MILPHNLSFPIIGCFPKKIEHFLTKLKNSSQFKKQKRR